MELPQVLIDFQLHNRTRIERFIEVTPQKKQPFFLLLPLLFQSNEPNLPCYVPNAPQGITQYQPSAGAINSAKILHRGFNYKPHAFLQFPLQGLYLINDSGSLFYPENEEFDLLLVYADNVPKDQVSLLQKKLDEVVIWAETFDITITPTLISQSAHTHDPLPSDYVDRLYSSGLILAGSVPLWWFVPPEKDNETDYAQYATAAMSEHSATVSIVDFGPLRSRSAATVFKQGFTYSMRVMENGLPCFLDLLYHRTILEKFPDAPWLSSAYKKAIYHHAVDVFLCDPAVIKLYYLSTQLSESLLALVRRSFYLLCDEKLTFTIKNSPHPWRRSALEALPTGWSWSDYNIKAIDHRYEARFRERLTEFKQTGVLTQKFNSLLSSFAKQYQLDFSAEQKELNSLYRELFDNSPDIISALPLAYLPEEPEEFLFLDRNNDQQDWRLYDQENRGKQTLEPLYHNESLLQILSWAISNKVLAKSSRIRIIDQTGLVAASTSLALSDYLLKSPIAQALSPDLSKDETLLCWQLFANIEQTPSEAFKRQDLKLAPQQLDPFNYGFHRRNLITVLEGIALSSHGQNHYFRYEGSDAIANMLTSLLRWNPTEELKELTSWCPTPNLGTRIYQRLTLVCTQLLEHYRRHPDSGNYLIEVAERIYQIEWHEQGADYSVSRKNQALDSLLAKDKAIFSATAIDSLLDHTGLYSLLLSQQANNKISLFLYEGAKQTTVYILDEVGSIYNVYFEIMKEQTIIMHMKEFFNSSIPQQQPLQLQFFKLKHKQSTWTLSDLALTDDVVRSNYFPVKIELENTSETSKCTIHCGTTVFKGYLNNPDLFKKVRDLVLEFRSSKSTYPLYISKLSYLEQGSNTSRHYFNHKQQLEQKLN